MKFITESLVLFFLLGIMTAGCGTQYSTPKTNNEENVYIGKSGVGQGDIFISKHFIEKSSIEYSTNDSNEKIVRYWEIRVVPDFEKQLLMEKDAKYKNLKKIRSLLEINCSTRKYKCSSEIRQYIDENDNLIYEGPSEKCGWRDKDGNLSPWGAITQYSPSWLESYNYLCK